VRLLCGQSQESGSALVYNGLSGKLYRTTFNRDPDCPNHTALDWAAVRLLPSPAAETTAREVLELARPDLDGEPTLDLGRDVLLAFVCPGCGEREERAHIVRLVDAEESRCPTCGTLRTSKIASTGTRDDPWIDRPLAQLGIPDGEVISVRGREKVLMYEIPVTGDR
jgi:hypothetical protein